LNEIANQRRKIIFNRRLDGTIVKWAWNEEPIEKI
jgi:hypothetical protein